MTAKHHRGQPPRLRRAAVTVEFAITGPILFLFVMGGIEFSRANMLLHTAAIAATAGARAGIVPGATAADCSRVALSELALVGLRGGAAVVTPAAITDTTHSVTVEVSVPLSAANGYFTARFFLGDTFTRRATLRRET